MKIVKCIDELLHISHNIKNGKICFDHKGTTIEITENIEFYAAYSLFIDNIPFLFNTIPKFIIEMMKNKSTIHNMVNWYSVQQLECRSDFMNTKDFKNMKRMIG